MNRTLLIAYREYLENVRTKGFWIGIFMMPVILLMVAIIPVIVESTRAAKVYAVIDESGQILHAVDVLIETTDFKKFIKEYDRDEVDELPGYLVTMLPEIQVLEDNRIDAIIGVILYDEPVPADLPRRMESFLAKYGSDIRTWWKSTPAKIKNRLVPTISTHSFLRLESNESIKTLNRKLVDGEIFAYFVIGKNPVESSHGSRYVSNNLTDQDLLNWFSAFVSQHVRDARLLESKVDNTTATWINERIEFEGIRLSDDGNEEEVDNTDVARQWAPVVFVYFLWISILINTQMLIANTIEEKSNKLIEVLLSSVSPIVLMAGKIIGIAGTGLTIITSWIVMALAFFIGLPLLAGVTLPIDLSSVMADPWFLGSFVVYFLLGYLLYAALLVGLGSMCNNLKEAQNLMLPVQMIQMMPILLMIPIGRDPNGTLAQILSYIPPLTPFVMMNRAAGPPSTEEYVITTLILIVSIAAAFWLAAKMFRVGILMTGKPPGFMEIIRLIRAPVSDVRSWTSQADT